MASEDVREVVPEIVATMSNATYKGEKGTFNDLTPEQKESLRGPRGYQGPQGDTGPKGATGPQGEQGPAGTDGEDGITPEITVSNITGGHTISISYGTDDPRNSSFNVMDGADGSAGSAGQNGSDGITPTITATTIAGGHNISISYGTDDPRNTSFDVLDGVDGLPGADGGTGPTGADGVDGITPDITVTSITGGHTVTIDYGSGDSRNTSFNVMDGATGATGPAGTYTAGTGISISNGQISLSSNPVPAISNGDAGKVLAVNSGETGVEWATPSSGGGTSMKTIFLGGDRRNRDQDKTAINNIPQADLDYIVNFLTAERTTPGSGYAQYPLQIMLNGEGMLMSYLGWDRVWNDGHARSTGPIFGTFQQVDTWSGQVMLAVQLVPAYTEGVITGLSTYNIYYSRPASGSNFNYQNWNYGLNAHCISHNGSGGTVFLSDFMDSHDTKLPDGPSADGTYNLQCGVSSGSKAYSWETASSGGSSYTAGDGIHIDSNDVISANMNPLIHSMLLMTTAGNDMPGVVRLTDTSTWEEFVDSIKAGKIVYITTSTSYTFSESYKLTPALLGITTLRALNIDAVSIAMMSPSVSSYPATGTQIYYQTFYYFDGDFLWSWKKPEDLGNFIKVHYRNSNNVALGYALQQITNSIDGITTLPSDPSSDGAYVLTNTVSSGTAIQSWEAASSGGGSSGPSMRTIYLNGSRNNRDNEKTAIANIPQADYDYLINFLKAEHTTAGSGMDNYPLQIMLNGEKAIMSYIGRTQFSYGQPTFVSWMKYNNALVVLSLQFRITYTEGEVTGISGYDIKYARPPYMSGETVWNTNYDYGISADSVIYYNSKPYFLSTLLNTYNTKLPDLPSNPTDGTYALIATVSNGAVSYSWESISLS